MLCYSDSTWKKWLNPTSNLNRYRVRDYRQVFELFLPGYQLDVLERDQDKFEAARARILSHFLSGDDQEDAVTQIRVSGLKRG
jgi:hypothetical protein